MSYCLVLLKNTFSQLSINISVYTAYPRVRSVKYLLYVLFIFFRFRQFLKDVSKIPLSVGEYESAEKNDVEIFDESDKVTVNDFLETMMSGENSTP